MKAEEVPQDLIDILDERAERKHSREGSVVATLAEILTRYEETRRTIVVGDPWVSARLREAANVVADKVHSSAAESFDGLFLELADRAEFMEKLGIDPVRETNWGMVFAHATIYAARILEEERNASA